MGDALEFFGALPAEGGGSDMKVPEGSGEQSNGSDCGQCADCCDCGDCSCDCGIW